MKFDYAIETLKIQKYKLMIQNKDMKNRYPDPADFSNVFPVYQENEELILEIRQAIKILESEDK